MSTVWRFTGPPENWITAITKGYWALDAGHEDLWNDIEDGDIAFFHSTGDSDYKRTPSVVAGYAVIGAHKFEKDNLWWIKEIRNRELIWKYAFSLDKIYVFSEELGIDFHTPIEQKSDEQIVQEIQRFTSQGIHLKELNKRAKSIDPDGAQFPFNGSGSRILNPLFEEILLNSDIEFIALNRDAEDFKEIEERIAPTIDENIAGKTKDQVLSEARNFTDSGPSHTERQKKAKLRRENTKQKRRIAFLEDYSCQICEFNYQYKTASGKTAWIIQVDHIIPKATGSGEQIDNLWVLCPNCHEKKTRGVIVIDPEKKVIKEKGERIFLKHDNHLGWGKLK